MNPLYQIPEDLSQLSNEELQEFVSATRERIVEVTSAPDEFVSDERTSADLISETRQAAEALQEARELLASRAEEENDEAEVETAAAEGGEEFAAELAELAAVAREDDEEEAEEEAEEVETAATEEVVTAAAEPPAPARRRLPPPARNRRPAEREQELVSLTASGAGVPGMEAGESFPSMVEVAKAMLEKKRHWNGIVAGAGNGDVENVPIARAEWGHLYPEERRLTGDIVTDMALVASATSDVAIRGEFLRRKKDALVASGGLCAPVTPYYQLQVISTGGRPVRATLPAFNATRGGIRFARPAALTVIDTAIGRQTMADDASGGSAAVKGCQTVVCPDWEEVEIATIYHCLRMGNVMQRTFPELLAQWNELAVAAQARFADGHLLTGMDNASTQVTAASLGFGAIGDLLPQVLTAAEGMRSRHRMSEQAILRLLMPDWAIALLVSDSIRSEFQRLDTDEARITAKLREFGVEPTFYLDSADGKNQIFGPQADGALIPFPATVNWFLYPEGSFLFIDGGSLELGLVRDSVLNSTNDFQLFGETFENVAFIGVESLSVTSALCDSGVVAAPATITECGDYGVS